jgi:hypothetical protein
MEMGEQLRMLLGNNHMLPLLHILQGKDQLLGNDLAYPLTTN